MGEEKLVAILEEEILEKHEGDRQRGEYGEEGEVVMKEEEEGEEEEEEEPTKHEYIMSKDASPDTSGDGTAAAIFPSQL